MMVSIFTRDVSANLLQLRQNDPFSAQKLGHILNLTQKVQNFGVIYLYFILKKKKKKRLMKAICQQGHALTFPSCEKFPFIFIFYFYYFFLRNNHTQKLLFIYF